jgi:sulfur carrier protein
VGRSTSIKRCPILLHLPYCSIVLLFYFSIFRRSQRVTIVLLYMPEKIEIILNGEKARISTEWTVNDLIEDLELMGRQVAVELNGQIISRDRWQQETLASGDRVEVVHFVGGGEN